MTSTSTVKYLFTCFKREKQEQLTIIFLSVSGRVQFSGCFSNSTCGCIETLFKGLQSSKIVSFNFPQFLETSIEKQLLHLLHTLTLVPPEIFALWCRHCLLVSKIPLLPCSLDLWAFCFSFDNVFLNSFIYHCSIGTCFPISIIIIIVLYHCFLIVVTYSFHKKILHIPYLTIILGIPFSISHNLLNPEEMPYCETSETPFEAWFTLVS